MKTRSLKFFILTVVSAAIISIVMGCGNKGSVGDMRAGAIFLTANRLCLPPDGRSSTAINAVVVDAAGYPAQIGTDVTFRTTLGTFPNNTKIFNTEVIDWSGDTIVSLIAGFDVGWAQVEVSANSIRQLINILIAPPSSWPCECFGEDACAEEAESEEDTEEGGAVLDPTALQTINLMADAPSAVANGMDSVVLTVQVMDDTGQAVPAGTPVTLTTTLGQFANGQTSYAMVTTDNSGLISTPLFAGTTPGMASVYAAYEGKSDMIAIGFIAP